MEVRRRGPFSIDHLRRIVLSDIPLSTLNLAALVFEFDNGPAENWWLGRAGGYLYLTWEEAQEYRRPLVKGKNSLLGRLWCKCLLVTVGPALKIGNTISVLLLDWGQCLIVNRLLYSWGVGGAFRGVPKLSDEEVS